jgi:23S rRNA (cytosine1962-C5)-methyltransferase
MIVVKLNKRGMEKILRHHLWIFLDEIKTVISDEVSGIANLFYDDKFVGKGLYNGKSKNAIKVLTLKDTEINAEFFEKRFKTATVRRKNLSQYRREINSEGDLIPGLVVDRFGQTLVIQIRSLALEKMKNFIIDALVNVYSPNSIYERSDFESLPEEGLSRNKGLLYGKVPISQIVEEDDLKFLVDVVKGQKTGFFYDQRESRKLARKLAFEGKALDLFTYTGGFALNLAKSGMDVDAVDISSQDLEIGHQNAEMNGLKVNFIKQDAFNIKNLDLYDLIIADPPSLIKRKTEKSKAVDFFSELTDQIIDHLKDKGYACICSCAYNVNAEMIERIVMNSSTKKSIIIRPICWTGLPIDHPYLLSMPETNYLKCFWFERAIGI